MSHSLTVNLSEEVYTYLQAIAKSTRQPVERLAQLSIEGNLPPSVTGAPLEMQSTLLAMQTYSIDRLRRIAESQVNSEEQQRHLALLEKNSQRSLSTSEPSELAELGRQADKLMLQKAYAWALLRWHGQPLPTLAELPIN